MNDSKNPDNQSARAAVVGKCLERIVAELDKRDMGDIKTENLLALVLKFAAGLRDENEVREETPGYPLTMADFITEVLAAGGEASRPEEETRREGGRSCFLKDGGQTPPDDVPRRVRGQTPSTSWPSPKRGRLRSVMGSDPFGAWDIRGVFTRRGFQCPRSGRRLSC